MLPNPSINTEFIEWFVGLCEAESNFLIRIRKNESGGVIGFEFVFRIALHIDDRKVLSSFLPVDSITVGPNNRYLFAFFLFFFN